MQVVARIRNGMAAVRAAPRRREPSVRARIAVAMVLLSALALSSAGMVAFVLQHGHVDSTIDDALRQAGTEFEAFAADGVDPRTGVAYTSADNLVYGALQLTVPERNEGLLGILDGQVRWTAPTSVPLRPEDDPELVATAIEAAGRDAMMTIYSATTAMGDYRFLVIPVQVGDSSGTVVHAIDRTAEHAEFNRIFEIYAWVAAAAVLVIALVGWTLAGRLLRPLRVLGQTAHQISDTDLSRRIPVTGNDDLAALAMTVNAMLDRLEGAFTSQRQMLDDVGHELRTPLTIVRGHLELMDAEDARDASETRDLVLDEVQRMQRIVNDLMTLATLEQPDFVRLEPTDVGRLTDDVHDKLRPLGDRRWRVDERAAATVSLDPQRITQALLQLGANAVQHSDPGSTIAVGSAVVPGIGLRLWVRDEGTGVQPEDQARIFVRFERAGPDARRSSGAGLGLAIVAAIAAAHGGRVALESVPGEGATFTLEVPAIHLVRPSGPPTPVSVEPVELGQER